MSLVLRARLSWYLRPITAPGKQCTLPSSAGFIALYADNCFRILLYLSTIQGLSSVMTNWRRDQKCRDVMNKGMITSLNSWKRFPVNPPEEKTMAGTSWVKWQAGGSMFPWSIYLHWANSLHGDFVIFPCIWLNTLFKFIWTLIRQYVNCMVVDPNWFIGDADFWMKIWVARKSSGFKLDSIFPWLNVSNLSYIN